MGDIAPVHFSAGRALARSAAGVGEATGVRSSPVPLDARLVKDAARRAGFSRCGIARAVPLDPGPLDRMLAQGYEADMAWIRTRREERLDPALLLPGARSVVVVALAY